MKPTDWVAVADDENKRAACVGHIDASGKRLTGAMLTLRNVRRNLVRDGIPHTLPPRSTLPGSTITDTE